MVLPSAAAGFWAAVLGFQRCTYNNSCLFVACSQISVSLGVTALLANHIHFASHNARHSDSNFINRGISLLVRYNFYV